MYIGVTEHSEWPVVVLDRAEAQRECIDGVPMASPNVSGVVFVTDWERCWVFLLIAAHIQRQNNQLVTIRKTVQVDTSSSFRV